jgi:hypothetical protein
MPSSQHLRPSRRVAWPEPEKPEGGEVRLTWGRLAAIVTTLFTLAGGIPLIWSFSDHWMNRQEIQTAMKAHADHDASIQSWNQYGFAANRLEYLDDRQAECDAKKLVVKELSIEDASICARYKAKYDVKQKEAADLKAEAMKTTKEK